MAHARHPTRAITFFALLAFGWAGAMACDDDGGATDGDGDTDVDGDVDGDGDSDRDTAPEPSFDGSVGNDGGWLEDADVPEPSYCPDEGGCEADFGAGFGTECENGIDEDHDGLTDCVDFGCRSHPACCAPSDRRWVEGDFDLCPSLAECRWTVFVGDEPATTLRLESGDLLLGGDGVGEVGVYSEPFPELSGAPVVRAELRLSDSSCTPTGCRQALGMAITAQGEPSSASGVVPHVGIVLDGEQERAHLYVAARRAASLEAPISTLTDRRGYAFRVEPDGTVSFWVAREPTAPTPLTDTPPDFTSTSSVPVGGMPMRLALFGRLYGGDAASVRRAGLERMVCDAPEGWSRDAVPVLVAEGGDHPRSPSVMVRSSGQLVLAFEESSRIAMASSEDGVAWTRGGVAIPGAFEIDYGQVGVTSPALLHWPSGPGGPYHLYYVGEAESGGWTPAGARRTAILHAVSGDGLVWSAAEQPVAIHGAWPPPEADTGPVPEGRQEVDGPAVVARPSGDLLMFFVGRDALTGETAIFRATSDDGATWSIWPEPIALGAGQADASDRDGVANPTVLVEGGALHLWYEGIRGASTSILHAVSGDDGDRWVRYGPVLPPALAWERGRTGAPAAVRYVDLETAASMMLLYYAAGPIGLEQVGVAMREVPPLY